MLGGIWVTAVLAIVFVLLAAKTFGWTFFNATNVNFVNWFYGYTTTDPTIPIWSYPPLIASFLIDSRIVQIAIVVLFGAWFLGWSGTLFLSSTRMIFAAAFDRVLPEAAARVSERRGVPWVALLFIMIPAIVVSAIYAYSSDFRALTLDATLVIAVTFLGSSVAATILPWWKPQIFNNSPVARYKSLRGGTAVSSLPGRRSRRDPRRDPSRLATHRPGRGADRCPGPARDRANDWGRCGAGVEEEIARGAT